MRPEADHLAPRVPAALGVATALSERVPDRSDDTASLRLIKNWHVADDPLQRRCDPPSVSQSKGVSPQRWSSASTTSTSTEAVAV
jgi:hypothetical protein